MVPATGITHYHNPAPAGAAEPPVCHVIHQSAPIGNNVLSTTISPLSSPTNQPTHSPSPPHHPSSEPAPSNQPANHPLGPLPTSPPRPLSEPASRRPWNAEARCRFPEPARWPGPAQALHPSEPARDREAPYSPLPPQIVTSHFTFQLSD